jgi:competence protein ComEC
MTAALRPRDGPTGLLLSLGALAWLGGTSAQLQQAALWPVGVPSALLAAGAALLIGGWRAAGKRHDAAPMPPQAVLAVITVITGLFLMAFSITAIRAQWRLDEALDPRLEGRDLVLVGRVDSLPRRNDLGAQFELAVERATLDGRPVAVPPRLWLGWYGGWQEGVPVASPLAQLEAGQRWRLPVRLRAPHGLFNPHGFDQELWLWERALRATGTVRATPAAPAALLAADAGAPVQRWRQRVRDAIDARVPDERSAGVLAALAVGDQAAIDRADWDLYRVAGIAHLMSISGLHVTMFAWLAGGVVGRLWRLGRRTVLWLPAPVVARWGGLAAAAGYAVLAGWGVPAQRTVWMLAVAAVLLQSGRRWPWSLVLLAAAAMVAAIDPWALLQPGFWLSFVAVGLLRASEPAGRVGGHDGAARTGRRAAVLASIRQGLRAQAVATVGLAPLTLVFFQQVSVVGIVANLIAIPLVTLLVTPLALLGLLVPPLWTVAATAVQGLGALLGAMAAWPAAVWNAAAAPAWAQAAALAGAALAVMPWPWRLRLLALPLMLPLFAPPVPRPAFGHMQVLVADVGQGSAVLVRTRDHALLHDAGPQYGRHGDAGSRVLLPLLRALGVGPIDLLMLSHRDTDHVGGAAAVLGGHEVRALSSSLEPGHPLLAHAPPHRRCEAGQAWQWDGVRFEVLHPTPDDYLRPGAPPNTLSCVLAVTDAAGRRLLLTGDLEAAQEARLVERAGADALRSDVLLVPHHGSRTSSSMAFLDAVVPRVALVQAGHRNRFGHPAPEVAARYAQRGIALLTTPACGAWTADIGSVAHCERHARRRYWHDGLEVAPDGGKALPQETAPWRSTSR